MWAENWTGVNEVPNEVVTHFGLEGDKHTLTVVGDPNGTVYKESYGTGWQRGLTTQSEVWAGGSLQKVNTTQWTQDNTNLNYQTNPRVTETNILDSAGNHSRTTVGYNTFTLPGGTSCSVPADVYEYEANATTVARRSHTDYNLDANYLNARLIGLPRPGSFTKVLRPSWPRAPTFMIGAASTCRTCPLRPLSIMEATRLTLQSGAATWWTYCAGM